MDDDMTKMPSMLLIGGTGRKIGKTTLASMIIEHFAKTNEIIGLKISNMKPGDEAFHGFHEHRLHENFSILKENQIGNKDSQRMLGSGATPSFFIRVQDEFIDEAFAALLQKIAKNAIVVCESNSLRNIVEPGLFLMVHDNSGKPLKAESEKLLAMADVQLIAHEYPEFKETINKIQLLETGWSFKS